METDQVGYSFLIRPKPYCHLNNEMGSSRKLTSEKPGGLGVEHVT